MNAATRNELMAAGLNRSASRLEADRKSASRVPATTMTAPRRASFIRHRFRTRRMTSTSSWRRSNPCVPSSMSAVSLPVRIHPYEATESVPFRDSWLAMAVSAASRSSPATSRYHHRPCCRSDSATVNSVGPSSPVAAGPARPETDATSSAGSSGAKSDSARVQIHGNPGRLGRVVGRPHLIHAVFGQLDDAGLGRRHLDLCLGRRHHHPLGASTEGVRKVDDLANGAPGRRGLVARQVRGRAGGPAAGTPASAPRCSRCRRASMPPRSRARRRSAAPRWPPPHRRTARAPGRSARA